MSAVEERVSGSSVVPRIAAIIHPALDGCYRAFDASVAYNRCAQLAVALRLYRMQHRRYPDTLAELVPEFIDKVPVDPSTGKPVVYVKEGKGFMLTSEGGEPRKDWRYQDIVWKCSR